jgi:hypothetical protein
MIYRINMMKICVRIYKESMEVLTRGLLTSKIKSRSYNNNSPIIPGIMRNGGVNVMNMSYNSLNGKLRLWMQRLKKNL